MNARYSEAIRDAACDTPLSAFCHTYGEGLPMSRGLLAPALSVIRKRAEPEWNGQEMGTHFGSLNSNHGGLILVH